MNQATASRAVINIVVLRAETGQIHTEKAGQFLAEANKYIGMLGGVLLLTALQTPSPDQPCLTPSET
jgi:hypothetical protein